MSEKTLRLIDVLAPSEYDEIDRFCTRHPGADSFPQLSAFLADRFSVELNLDPDIVVGFSTDSSNLPGNARALCRPGSERECAAIFRACFRAGIPLTISGGRSNLTGSATPEGGVIVSTVKMLTPEVKVNAGEMTVEAPVGIILEEMRRLVVERSGGRLIYPVDPTSRGDATVGGTIACNASGFTPGEAGATRLWVESVDFLFPNGLAVRARRGQYVSSGGKFILERGGGTSEMPVPTYPRPSIKNAGGPYSSPSGAMDFMDLVVGSEGIFGLVTACSLKLAPRPLEYLDLFFSLPAEKDAVALYHRLRGRVGSLSAFEYFGVNCRKYIDHERRLFRGDDEVAVYLQIPLSVEAVEAAAEEWLDILLGAGCNIDGDAVLLLDNERDRNVFMEARHSMPANALEVVRHRGTYTIMTDTVVPPERFAEFLEYARGIIAAEGMDYLSFGHLGDCHLHFTILPEKAQLERAAELYDMIVARSAELGGVYSGEHGTGKRKRKDFVRCYGESAVEELRRCKASIDPAFLLNRGNVFEAPGRGAASPGRSC